jgi:hypothetical protein
MTQSDKEKLGATSLDNALDDSFPASDPPSQSDPTHGIRSGGSDLQDDAIRQRAYEIWEREGSPHGSHEVHWEQARRELEAEKSPN